MKKIAIAAWGAAALFFALTAGFGLDSPAIWNSPDETAVAFFSAQLASNGTLSALEPFNALKLDIVHPRSVISVDGFLVPGSFYGSMYFFSALMKAIGSSALALGTPLIASLAGVVVFFAFRRLRGDRVALFAELFFFLNPAVWYYASRGLFPNLLFWSLAIISVGLFYLQPLRTWSSGRGNRLLEEAIDATLAALPLGLAALVRPTELIFLVPILLVWAFRSRRAIRPAAVIAAGAWLGVFAATFLIVNSSLYGSPWAVGYTAGANVPGVAAPALGLSSSLPAAVSAPRPFILPFGFHPRAAFAHLRDYLFLFAWWLPLAAAAGFFVAPKSARRPWIWLWLWAAAFVGIYYGSGVFADSSVSQWTVGSSYVRYFLPAGILLAPLAAEAAEAVVRRRRWAAIAALGAFAALGAWTVYFRSAESLVPMRANLVHYRDVRNYVLGETKPGDFIVTERSDKIFFPDRRIVLNLRDPATLAAIPKMAGWGNVYYYGITIAEGELPKINSSLHGIGFQLGRIKSWGNETLYGITKEE